MIISDDRIQKLVVKYDVPVPRYTSYPTVPYWDSDKFSTEGWEIAVKKCFEESNGSKGISLYIHLPFCESLCTYCACNTRITKNHKVEETYIEALLNEWDLYRVLFGKPPVIREFHLGGGTPTFFSPANLQYLLDSILQKSIIHKNFEFSFEGHPNNTSKEHLQVLFNAGFRRVSFGVQDLNEKVQTAIHRIQPFENVEAVTKWSRDIGYNSVNFDLVYGLPYQTIESVVDTVNRVIELRPDRIAFYSYAHVPWIKPGQRGYEDSDLPTDVEKRELYEAGKLLLEKAGYRNIGMDHFALITDSLAEAQVKGTLHRNFMGYTTSSTDLLIGLGASAISDAKYAYAQNTKRVEEYQQMVNASELAVIKGHSLSSDDQLIRECILGVACAGKLSRKLMNEMLTQEIVAEVEVMESEGLVAFTEDELLITELGKMFLRNICSVFDAKLREKSQQRTNLFSRAI